MKREAGASPARTRRCKKGVSFPQAQALRTSLVATGKTKRNVDIQVRRPAYYDVVGPRVIG